MTATTETPQRVSLRVRVQQLGTALSNMVMPNIGAFIAWGLITALFIKTGWLPGLVDSLQSPDGWVAHIGGWGAFEKGGIVGRDTATADGSIYVLEALLEYQHRSLEKIEVAVQAVRAAGAPASEGAPDGADLPGGSPAAAYEAFLSGHAQAWMPAFAERLAAEARHPFYRAAAAYLGALLADWPSEA